MDQYRNVHLDGSVEYTDVPAGVSDYRPVPPGQQEKHNGSPSAEEQRRSKYERARLLMKEAQKRIPKVQDHLEHIAYLGTDSRACFDDVTREMKKTDSQTWLKLQKYRQSRLSGEAVTGVKACEDLIGAGPRIGRRALHGQLREVR
jgi:hypothetical protein